jgi:PAT family beta-lactamase induction signal transducer AmpG
LFWVTGLASATQDVAADGVYITSTTPREQALYVGVQGICWSIGRIIAAGLLVSFTGHLHDELGMPWTRAWTIVFAILAALMGLSAAWHARVLPSGGRAADAPANLREAARTFASAFVTFFRKPRIAMMIGVVLCYRLGEGLIEKIGPLFMLDGRGVGGLGLNNVQLGNINGTYGTIGFIGGTLLGGFFSAKIGLRRSFFLLALALNVPHVTYFYLSQARPESLLAVTTLVTIEKFGYGFGSVGHMLYMMQQVAPGPFKTAHYAFATGLMAVSMMVTGMVSGFLQQATGYQTFFVIALVASIPPLLFAWFAPFPVAETPGAPRAAAGH